MRVLYDGEVYQIQASGGVNRYFDNVISHLPINFEPSLVVGEKLPTNLPAHQNLKVYHSARRRPNLESISHRGALYFYKISNWLLWSDLKRAAFDVFHPTYYNLVTGREIASYRLPVVITVWDMIHEIFQPQIDPTGFVADLKRRAILAAQQIICISENTKRDLLEKYPICEGKVTVTWLASDIDASLSHGCEPVPTRPYYLYVGNRTPYKNFDGLLRAFGKAVSVKPELALCLVGPPFSQTEVRLINEFGLGRNVEHYGHITDSHLAKLYRCSRALIYPSLYEGFGIPPLEAMACGTVAVVSNASSLPEVVGDAGLLFDPRRLDDLTDIIISVMDNEALRSELISRGRQRAQLFTWGRTAAQTVEVYRLLSE